MKNIVLIGIMGCGKTSIGLKLSQLIKYNFIDTDKIIESKHGPIPKLFEISEDYFRSIESKVIEDISFSDKTIISTGGGVVLNKKNIDFLKRNGIIIFINRNPENIVKSIQTKNRPLLSNGADKLFSIYKQRLDLYKKYSDYIVDNNQKEKDAVNKILNIIYTI